EHVWGAAVAGRAHVDLGRMCLGIGDELRNGLGRERGIDHHEKGNNADTRNGRNIADEIEVEIVVDRRIDRVRRCHEEKGVSVRRCTHDDFSADIAAGTWSIVDTTIKDWPNLSDSSRAIKRAVMSGPSPAGKPTIMRTGRLG